MHQLIQELKFFDKEELEYLNGKLDVMEFVGCPVGFTDGNTGNSRIEKSESLRRKLSYWKSF